MYAILVGQEVDVILEFLVPVPTHHAEIMEIVLLWVILIGVNVRQVGPVEIALTELTHALHLPAEMKAPAELYLMAPTHAIAEVVT